MDKDSKLAATTKGKSPVTMEKAEEKKENAAKADMNMKVEEKPVIAKKEVKLEAKKEDAVIVKKAVEETKELPKKPAPKKKTAKAEKVAKPAKTKTSVKKKETAVGKIKVSTYIQYLGKEIEQEQLIEKVKANWTDQGNDASGIKNLELYVKPEEGAVYYVVNGIPDSGKVDF